MPTNKPYALNIRLPHSDGNSDPSSQFSASRRIVDELSAHFGLSANKVTQRALRVLHQQVFPEQYTDTHKAASSAPAGTKKVAPAKRKA